MRAVLIQGDRLVIGETADPQPGPHDVVVQVEATALNRADLLQRKGHYPPPPGASEILGLEMAGTVVETGQAVTRWQPGDRVCGLLAGGGYAERVAIHEDIALPVPEGISVEEAAALPEVFMTAVQALHWLGELQAGETVLIHAGASGVGTAAIQLARYAGARVVVTASGPKLDACRRLGAERAINYKQDDFAEQVRDHTEGHGADLIIDFIGGPYLKPNMASLAVDGRIVLLAMLGGARVEDLHLGALFGKRGRLITSTLRNRSLDYKARLAGAVAEQVWPGFAAGALHPVIDRIYDWTDVEAAHDRMAANRNVGKIVLRVGDLRMSNRENSGGSIP